MIIDSTYDYKKLALFQELALRESKFIAKIDEVISNLKNLLNTRIPVVFPKYTLHDTGHSFRIMNYMSEIITDIKLLDELEIVLLIYSALLHDVGMALDESDILLIKADKFDETDIKLSTLKRVNGYDDTVALQEYTRRIHAQLSGRYITRNKHLFLLPAPNSPTLNFAKELALICESHTQDIDWITRNLTPHEVRGSFSFNSQFIAGILRLADIMDIDSSRTPYHLYKSIAPTGVSNEEWKQHFIISNEKKIENNPKNNLKNIVFYGSSDNPAIHRKLLSYIDWVNEELVKVSGLVNKMLPVYNIHFENNVINNIQPVNFTYSDYKMTLDFKAISALLMGEKIYGDKTLGLRELIQNSKDACRLKNEKIAAKMEFGGEEFKGHIKVVLNKAKNTITIKDNGIGMSLSVIKKHFLNIGVSYYTSQEFKLRDFSYQPIGNFGIGFLSGFMLSSQVTVITKAMDSDLKYTIELEKGSEYTSLTNVHDLSFEGTEVILIYSEFMQLFANDKLKVATFLEKYFLTDGVDFTIIDIDAKTKTPIVNLLNDPNPIEEGSYKIFFQDHLKDIEGYALLKPKRSFIKSFKDLVFEGDLYQYDPEPEYGGLAVIRDTSVINIDDFIIGRELKYLAIPLVPFDKEDKFLNGLEYTGDNVEEVIGTFSHELDWISVLCPKKLIDGFKEKDIEEDDEIIGKLSFLYLKSLGHSRDCKTRVFIRSIDLYEGQKNTLYMPFKPSETLDGWSYMYLIKKEENKRLYMRNVFIRDFAYHLPIIANVFEITKIVTNISSREFIPDISRNNLDLPTVENIVYMIGKAIHNGVLKLPLLDEDEKQTLKKFIETYYEKVTTFEIN